MSEFVAPQRVLGPSLTVPAIGLGTMPMSWEPMLDHRDRAVATVHAALDAGIRLFDSANIYAPSRDRVGYGEQLVAEAIRSWPGDTSNVVVASKAGIEMKPDGGVRNATRDHLRAACEASLESLDMDCIDLYYLHWPARSPSFASQVENMFALRSAGLVRSVGLSNIDRSQLAVALEIGGSVFDGGIVAVQNEFSPRYRENEDVIHLCAEAGIAYLPWSPFGGTDRARDVRTQYSAFAEVADIHGVSVYQVTLAWHLRMSPAVIAIPGCTRPDTILDCAKALKLKLTNEEFDVLNATVPEGTSQYPSDEPAPSLR